MNYRQLNESQKAMKDGCWSFEKCQTYQEQLNWLSNKSNLSNGYGSDIICNKKGNPAWLSWSDDNDGDFLFEDFLTTKSGDEIRQDLKNIGFNSFI